MTKGSPLVTFLIFMAIALAIWAVLRPRDVPEEAVPSEAELASSASLVVAGGCFWCVESDFDQVPGVIATTSGYAGGDVANPTYRQVVAGTTGHYEVVKIDYDPMQVSFDELLTAFWHSTNPTDAGGQFCDRGQSYATAIFVDGAQERAIAEASRDGLIAAGIPIVTPILESAAFYPAEDYHQDYYLKNPTRYAFYRFSCGRNATVAEVWGEDAYKGIPKS